MQSAALKWVLLAASLIGCVGCDTAPVCRVNRILCSNDEECIPMRYRCRGSTPHCSDGSDESPCGRQGCPDDKLGCDSGHCINRAFFCDGMYGCVDRSDEKDCGYEDSDIVFLSEGLDIYMKTRTKAGLEINFLLPIALKMKRTGFHNGMRVTGLSFDFRTFTLFVSDANRPAIFAVNVTSLSFKTRDLVTESITSPMDIAFDWTSNNLYWLDSGSGMAEVVSVDTLRRMVLIRELRNPVSLALSPNTGTMFIATSGFESRVYMYGMDGSKKRTLDLGSGRALSLALHPTKSILYWTDQVLGGVLYVNYSDTGVSYPQILKKDIRRVMSVTVTERDIYVTSGEPVSSERVLRLKNLGREKDEGWKSITSAVKPSGKHECLIENGGCDHLCLTTEIGRSCACATGKTLGEDGKSCLG